MRQVSLEDFRAGEGDQGAILFGVPKAIGVPRLRPPRPAAALVGRRLGNALGHHAHDTACRVEAGQARQAAVNDHGDLVERQRGFGNGGRQDDLGVAGCVGLQHARLVAKIHGAIELVDLDGRIDADLFGTLGDTVDLALAGQKDQQGFGARGGQLLRQPGHVAGDIGLHRQGLVAAEIMGIDRKSPAEALKRSGARQDGQHALTVERRRHDEQAQVVAQHRLGVTGEGQAEIGIKAAFVEFIEDDAAHAFERRIVEDAARENAFSDDLDAGFGADLAFAADTETDGFADALVQGLGHARGGGASCQPPGLQQDNRLAHKPGLIQQGQGDARGLAGAWRRDDDGGRLGGQPGL